MRSNYLCAVLLLPGLSVPPPLRQEPLPTPLPPKDHRPRYVFSLCHDDNTIILSNSFLGTVSAGLCFI